jgi:hypothetical protein
MLLTSAPPPASSRWPAVRQVLASAIIGAGVTVGMVALGVVGFRHYGWVLFLWTPFVMGVVVGYIVNMREPASSTRLVTALISSMGLTTLGFMVFAIEGLACLAMSAPLAVPLAMLGTTTGASLASRAAPQGVALGLLLLPVGWGLESATAPPPPLHEVRSSIDIDAPPDAVWPHVLAFPPLPEPTEWWFRTGLAYPREATIVGEGVGAVRYCTFSTGSFVEPITAWEPGRQLAFDVTSSPAPMREFSFWNGVHPPHLDGYLNSRRGEFRLIALPDGRTRLEGSTWYELHMAPGLYWRFVTDRIIQQIHERVLGHIKTQTEANAAF